MIGNSKGHGNSGFLLSYSREIKESNSAPGRVREWPGAQPLCSGSRLPGVMPRCTGHPTNMAALINLAWGTKNRCGKGLGMAATESIFEWEPPSLPLPLLPHALSLLKQSIRMHATQHDQDFFFLSIFLLVLERTSDENIEEPLKICMIT